ncbi:MAG: mevalonate kinase [Deltaproteobacteria bacterium]|nr:mevalonate kinase [Deltaproteobacteria bacterium]
MVPEQETAIAPGKVIIAGEHAVVYGHIALGFALSRRASVSLRPGHGNVRVHLDEAFALQTNPAAARGVTPTALVHRILGRQRNEIDVDIDLSIPPMSGLGSSAAIAVATARAFARFTGHKTTSDLEIFRRAMTAEKLAHGRPSGVDPAIVVSAGLVRFQRKSGRRGSVLARKRRVGARPEVHWRRIRPALPLSFVVAVAGHHGGTRGAVGQVTALHKDSGRMTRAAMTTLGEIAQASCLHVASGNIPALGRAMNLAHGVLLGLGLAHESVHEAVRIALAAGAIGAKMTGAGGQGGALIALAEDRLGAARIVRRLQKHALPCWAETVS